MLPIEALLPFLAASFFLTLAPGPDNLMVISYGLARGRKAAITFGLGCALGCATHTLWVVLGLAAVLKASPTALWSMKAVGAVYLLYLAQDLLRHGVDVLPAKLANEPEPLKRYLLRGFVANAINPKVTLFFLALLPQFVDAEVGNIAWQTIQLGLLFAAQTVLLFSLIAVFAGAVSERLEARPAISGHLSTVAALVFVLLAMALVLS